MKSIKVYERKRQRWKPQEILTSDIFDPVLTIRGDKELFIANLGYDDKFGYALAVEVGDYEWLLVVSPSGKKARIEPHARRVKK